MINEDDKICHSSVFRKIDFIIEKIENFGTGITFAAVVILVGITVFLRYVMNSGLMWAAEVQEILVVALAMFGGAKATREGGHTELSLITNMLPYNGRVILRTITSIASLIFLGTFFIVSLDYTLSTGNLKTIMLRIPYRYCYMFLPIGMGLILYEFIKRMKNRILVDKKDEY